MKNQWLLFFTGYVCIHIQGKELENFLNELLRQGVYIWNVKKIDREIIQCHVKLHHIPKLRQIRKQYHCTFTFTNKVGLPFTLKKARFYQGFVFGIIAFLLTLFFLSNIIWRIEVKGATTETEQLIKKELKKMGVNQGTFLFQLDNPQAIQKKLTKTLSHITWIGVQLKGTTYQFQVVEKEEPKKPDFLPPRHLVASKEAIVTKIYVETGKATVKENTYVKKGQLLISGSIGKKESSVQVAATGVVMGETWYQSNVEVPLQSEFPTYTGLFQRKNYLKIGSAQIKVWGFAKNTYKEWEEEVAEQPVYFLHWKLPIQFVKHTFYEQENLMRKYTVGEAVQVGKEIAEKELKQKLSKRAIIKEKKVLRQKVTGGKVKLKIYFVVEEDITMPKTIKSSKK